MTIRSARNEPEERGARESRDSFQKKTSAIGKGAVRAVAEAIESPAAGADDLQTLGVQATSCMYRRFISFNVSTTRNPSDAVFNADVGEAHNGIGRRRQERTI